MKILKILEDHNSEHHLYTIPPSDTINAKVLALGVAEVETDPADAKCVLFSCTGNFYAKYDAAAAIPAGDITDGTASDLNPSAYIVTAADTIGVIAPDNCVLTMSYYR